MASVHMISTFLLLQVLFVGLVVGDSASSWAPAWPASLAKLERSLQQPSGDSLTQQQTRRELVQSSSDTTTTSWWSNIKESLAGFVIGIILIVMAFPAVTYGEGSYVHRQACLDWVNKELKKSGGKQTSDGLVYASGVLVPAEDALSLPLFGLRVPNALRVRIKVEMYQNYVQRRQETRQNQVGGGTTTTTHYDVKQQWADINLDPNPSDPHSAAIMTGRANPDFPERVGKTRVMQTEVYIEKYSLSDSQRERLVKWEALPPPAPHSIPSELWNTEYSAGPSLRDGKYLYLPMASRGPTAAAFSTNRSYDNGYGGQQQDMERGMDGGVSVGDVRISFDVIRPEQYTIIAGLAFQHGDAQQYPKLETFQVMRYGEFTVPPCCSMGCCAVFNMLGSVANDVDELTPGMISPEEMVKQMKAADYTKLKIMRLVTFLMFFVGFYLIFNPIVVLLSVVAIIGNIVSVGLWLFAFVFAFLMTITTVCFAWLYYRPLRAILLAAFGVGVFFLISYLCSV
eukprot:gb/GEZN01004558.1/.p1 GENE.gb/GEZN01004558.1/~~gb/GEZN01004558.1/.p1  ORF type:complete len:512 (-),score=74.61 gb/GEZN01004558.1/:363-1898(-)